jgi:putative ABC transport system ATP-binding protein
MEPTSISISDLKFSWKTQESILLNIPDFKVERGEKVFLCGSSGSGKSTLLNLIGGVLSPNSGKLKILGENLADLSSAKKDQLRGDRLGFIFQMFNLIPYLSVMENVILPCRFSELKRRRVFEGGFGLEEEAERLLRQLKIDVNKVRTRPVTELSVGQQQRVATARALMGKPEIVIADEPTSALDTDTRNAFIELLFGECENSKSTILFVSHDAELGKKFDRTIYLKNLNHALRFPESTND